jgi:outer membrane protein assembly factor BamB
LFLTAAAGIASAQESWPRFRGPNGLGADASASIPIQWTDADFLWRVKLGGNGHGSPVVWGERLYLMVGDPAGQKVTLACRDTRSGQRLWGAEHPVRKNHLHDLNSYASTTPTVDDTGVYASWADADSFHLAAYSHAGDERWSKSLGKYQSSHGYSRSPIVVDDLVVLPSNQQSGSRLLAFDSHSGDEAWRAELPAGKAAYGTPCVIPTPDGGRAIVTYSSGHGMDAVDAATGKRLWQMPGVFPERCVGSPVYAGGLLLGASGSGGGGKLLVAVRPPSKSSSDPTEAYRVAKGAPYVPTPLVVDDLLVLWHDRGTVAGHDLATGKPLWSERVGGKFFASPVRAGGVLYNVSMDGQVVVLSVGRDGCNVLARNDLGEPSEATPAIAGGKMYLRTDESLMCIGSLRVSALPR